MRTEIYLRRDLTALLNAILVVYLQARRVRVFPGSKIYDAGYQAALLAVAAGLQIDPETELDPLPYVAPRDIIGQVPAKRIR